MSIAGGHRHDIEAKLSQLHAKAGEAIVAAAGIAHTDDHTGRETRDGERHRQPVVASRVDPARMRHIAVAGGHGAQATAVQGHAVRLLVNDGADRAQA